MRYPDVMTLFRTTDPEEAASGIRSAASGLIRQLRSAVPLAVHGNAEAARRYVDAWRGLAGRYLVAAREELPDAVMKASDHHWEQYLQYLALNAPFSPWVGRFGPGEGVAVYLLSEFRELIPGVQPLAAQEAPPRFPLWDVDRSAHSRFARLVWFNLQEDESSLERIARVLDLSQTELGKAFGVTRQAVGRWLEEGVPPARQPKVLVVAQIVDLLERNLIPGRIPAVARAKAPAYGGLSMLDLIGQDRHQELLESVRASFDWAAAG